MIPKAPRDLVLARAEELLAKGYRHSRGRPQNRERGLALVPELAKQFGVSARYIRLILNTRKEKLLDVQETTPLLSPSEVKADAAPSTPRECVLELTKAFDRFVDQYIELGAENFPSTLLSWVESGAHLTEKVLASKRFQE